MENSGIYLSVWPSHNLRVVGATLDIARTAFGAGWLELVRRLGVPHVKILETCPPSQLLDLKKHWSEVLGASQI